MLLNEIFDKVIDYKEISPDRYEFKINEIIYNVDFRKETLPKETQIKLDRLENVIGFEADFSIYTNNKQGRNFKFGITNTGNSILVFSTVSAIIQEFLNKENPEFFFFSAEEKSRQKLYDRLSKVLISKTNYELFHTLVNNYGKNYIFKLK